MTLKWLKVLKLSKICLQMVKAMTPKTTDQNILFLNERMDTRASWKISYYMYTCIYVSAKCCHPHKIKSLLTYLYHSVYTVDLMSVVSNY